ncbi:MAG: flavodoxin family protein [Candidatus Hodarchaeota archaeon]
MSQKSLIIYKSVFHGNTEKVAKAMAEVLNAELVEPHEIGADNLLKYDLIGLGSGIYNIKHHEDVLNFVDELPKMEGKKAFIFSTSGLRSIRIFHSFNKHLEKRLLEKGFNIIGKFSCRGYDNNGLLRLIGGINRGRPNENDLEKARRFARNLKASLLGD